jgi:hypothetical protein
MAWGHVLGYQPFESTVTATCVTFYNIQEFWIFFTEWIYDFIWVLEWITTIHPNSLNQFRFLRGRNWILKYYLDGFQDLGNWRGEQKSTHRKKAGVTLRQLFPHDVSVLHEQMKAVRLTKEFPSMETEDVTMFTKARRLSYPQPPESIS